MSFAENALLVGFIAIPAASLGMGIGAPLGRSQERAREIERSGTEERVAVENAHCARSGGRLVRGQAREFICVDPRGVKWARAR